MTAFDIASLVTQYIIGAGQIGVILYGISRMEKASDRRAKTTDQQHTESMAALQALIRGLDNQGEALKKQGQALETLIARTGSSGTA